ncbi:MAG TPA: cupin domain-containing protein [Phycisphaerae bacterium]|nr:cupin domain-containing protein [Phycisphaerales bacterium]HRX84866.1 cupin domain-containing protein [Phycisphaerae bacterium]
MNATIPAAKRRTLAITGGCYTFLATGADTANAYTLLEAYVPPHDPGPPPHVHSREEEAFFVLEGELTLTVDGRDQVLGRGGFCIGPRGVPHRFRNDGVVPARFLVLATPAGIEHFFAEIGTPWADPQQLPPPPTPADIERIITASPRHGITILPVR